MTLKLTKTEADILLQALDMARAVAQINEGNEKQQEKIPHPALVWWVHEKVAAQIEIVEEEEGLTNGTL
jgi:hypothetical protein